MPNRINWYWLLFIFAFAKNDESNYYALIIGVNEYWDENINDLENPVNDATTLFSALTEFYTFSEENILLLNNPKRSTIIMALDEMLQKYQKIGKGMKYIEPL